MKNIEQFQRIVVIGTSCAGKTTFAKNIARALGHRHVEMDELFWREDWTPKPAEVFYELAQETAATDTWVVDGNYRAVRDVFWSRATAVVWLNYSFPTVLWRAVRRTFGRILRRQSLWHGNTESLARTFSRDSILLWVATTHHRKQKEFEKLRQNNPYPHLIWLELNKPAAAHALLKNIQN